MADINKEEIKLFSSQRLDDTAQGGGAMTFNEIVDGMVNNLYPDISRLDRVYGRVSMRKAFMAVDTLLRPTYYGAHAVITKQADDPRVGVSFFTTEDWFDTRASAQSRVESYLAKGPVFGMALYGSHYSGSKALRCINGVSGNTPKIGDVLVLMTAKNIDNQPISVVTEYVRIRDITSAIHTLVSASGSPYSMQVMDITLGSALQHDFLGIEVAQQINYTILTTVIYTTIVADSARYYGIAPLAEDVTSGSLLFRVEYIGVPLVPSAQSQTSIVDAGAGNIVTPLIQADEGGASVIVKTIAYNTTSYGTVYLGAAILPGSFSIASGLVTDNSKGTLFHSSLGEVGSILYTTGTVTWVENWCPGLTNYSTTFQLAAAPTRVAKTGNIYVSIGNRGFVYVFDCDPIPAVGSLKVDFLVGGKWYSLWDQGTGELRGSDNSVGVGTVSYVTGSVSLTLGAMPDVGSDILFFWSEQVTYKSFAGWNASWEYFFKLQDSSIAANTFFMTWTQNSVLQTISDDGGGFLLWGAYLVGVIDYYLGLIVIQNLPITPPATTEFTFNYNKGAPVEETFASLSRGGDGRLTATLTNVGAIIPGTLTVAWGSKIQYYERDSVDRMVSAPPVPETPVSDTVGVPLPAGSTTQVNPDVEPDPDSYSDMYDLYYQKYNRIRIESAAASAAYESVNPFRPIMTTISRSY